jgi:hypothetical protein
MKRVYRVITSKITVGGRLIITLDPCGHQVIYPTIREPMFPTRRDGREIFRCPKCEELWTPPEGGKSA